MDTDADRSTPPTPARPEFTAKLGLQPPYTEEDVAEAYRSRVLVVHPDRGGNARDFIELQEAFERAEQFVRFRRDRRNWIAARMERYVALEETLDTLRRHGADVETEDWLAGPKTSACGSSPDV